MVGLLLRLATHLSCAFVIYSSLLYSALSLVLPKLAAPSAAALPAALAAHPRVRALRAMTLGSAALIGTTIVSGTALARYTLFGYGTGPLYPVRVRHWPATPFSRNRTWCVSSHRCGAACCALRLCKRFMEYSKWVIEYAAV